LTRLHFILEGGGQEPDHGTIGGFDVIDVIKHGDIVVHELKGGMPKKNETLRCVVDSKRRDGVTKHHTSTHILNSSSRSVLGSWVWQHSAFKEEDHARLDITHHSALTDDEVSKIEELANAKVKENIPVTIENFDRGTAEQKYGFRIYQGGVVPVKSVRIVSIADFDVEACGGTHTKTTKDVELIKITRKNIPALLEEISQTTVGTTKMRDIEVITTESRKFCWTKSDRYDEYFHINFGERLIKNDPKAVYCGIFETGDTVRAIVYAGDEAAKTKNADEIVKAISEALSGSGGGTATFAQGGGLDKSKKDDAIKYAKRMVFD